MPRGAGAERTRVSTPKRLPSPWPRRSAPLRRAGRARSGQPRSRRGSKAPPSSETGALVHSTTSLLPRMPLPQMLSARRPRSLLPAARPDIGLIHHTALHTAPWLRAHKATVCVLLTLDETRRGEVLRTPAAVALSKGLWCSVLLSAGGGGHSPLADVCPWCKVRIYLIVTLSYTLVTRARRTGRETSDCSTTRF